MFGILDGSAIDGLVPSMRGIWGREVAGFWNWWRDDWMYVGMDMSQVILS